MSDLLSVTWVVVVFFLAAVEVSAVTSAVPHVSAMYSPLRRINDSMTTITGQYSYVGNPCTTEPCLPGMIYAVSVNETVYYLTIDGCWLWENRSWNGYTPEIDDAVRVTGVTSEHTDIFGLPFFSIEVESIVRQF